MFALLLILGIALVTWTLFDALWTTLWAEGGAGPMTYYLDSGLWETAKWIANLGGEEFAHRRLSIAGPMIMGTTLMVWLLLLWIGFLLIFNSHTLAVVNANTGNPVDFTDRIWFTLYATTTLGNGDLAPETTLSQVLTGFAATSGLVLLTLSISFMMSIVDAVNEKRALAGEVFGAGGSIGEALRMMQVEDRGGIENRLASISSRAVAVARQHEAYPIVHFFHPMTAEKSAACALAQLDETLNLFESEMQEEDEAFNRTSVQPTRRAVTAFIETFEELYITGVERSPDLPSAERLQKAGVDMSVEDVERAVEASADRRQLLAALVEKDGWAWNEVVYREQQPDL